MHILRATPRATARSQGMHGKEIESLSGKQCRIQPKTTRAATATARAIAGALRAPKPSTDPCGTRCRDSESGICVCAYFDVPERGLNLRHVACHALASRRIFLEIGRASCRERVYCSV